MKESGKDNWSALRKKLDWTISHPRPTTTTTTTHTTTTATATTTTTTTTTTSKNRGNNLDSTIGSMVAHRLCLLRDL